MLITNQYTENCYNIRIGLGINCVLNIKGGRCVLNIKGGGGDGQGPSASTLLLLCF